MATGKGVKNESNMDKNICAAVGVKIIVLTFKMLVAILVAMIPAGNHHNQNGYRQPMA